MLLEFPCELVSALVAGRLSAKGRAFNPFLRGYLLRLLVAGVLTGLVSHFPFTNGHFRLFQPAVLKFWQPSTSICGVHWSRSVESWSVTCMPLMQTACARSCVSLLIAAPEEVAPVLPPAARCPWAPAEMCAWPVVVTSHACCKDES